MRQRMAGWWTAATLTLLTSVGGAMWAHAQAQTPAPSPASNGRVAIVDIQRILARSVAGAAAREQLADRLRLPDRRGEQEGPLGRDPGRSLPRRLRGAAHRPRSYVPGAAVGR